MKTAETLCFLPGSLRKFHADQRVQTAKETAVSEQIQSLKINTLRMSAGKPQVTVNNNPNEESHDIILKTFFILSASNNLGDKTLSATLVKQTLSYVPQFTRIYSEPILRQEQFQPLATGP